MPEPLASLVRQFIASQRTLVLATAGPDSQGLADPWAAPVYYHYRHPRFYFFSSPNSRHVVESLRQGRCGGAIFRDSADWREIEGLQMAGSVHPVAAGSESEAVFEGYVRKFPTVREFFAGREFDLAEFLARFRSQLYAFAPQRVCYLNNQAGLGKRQEIELPA